MTRYLSEYFTVPGRILVLLTIVLAAGGPWLVIFWIEDSLPPGRYPLWLFALPLLIIAALFFGLGALVLKALGVGVFKKSEDS